MRIAAQTYATNNVALPFSYPLILVILVIGSYYAMNKAIAGLLQLLKVIDIGRL